MIDGLLAHQGGWDEFLVLLSPVLLFAVLRMLERRRRTGTPASKPDGESPAAPPAD